jgi:hypothetical protein
LGKRGIGRVDAVGVLEDEWALTIKDEAVEGDAKRKKSI